MSSDTPQGDDLRLVRILAPAPLLREVDSLLREGRGGYQTRQEFFLDAVENQILEVTYGSAGHGQRRLLVDEDSANNGRSVSAPDKAASSKPRPNSAEAPVAEPPALVNGKPIEALADFTETEIHAPDRGPAMSDGLAVAADKPLFGLHNRDYPSVWAVQQLARQTSNGFVALKDFMETTVSEAWRFAASLDDLEQRSSTKLTALFPTNRAKPQSAEENFKAFAIGALAKNPLADGKLKATGPLYTWGVAQVQRAGEVLEIGLTESGYELLERLDGISLRHPHETHFAERFLSFLKIHAQADAAGFDYLLEVVPDGLTRVELADRFKQWQPDWSAAEANTHAAAYVARAREWGLLESTLIDRRYALTEFGEQLRGKVAA